ncbi:MAG: response regulator, partial [Thermoleophilia bacterium]|nr:response regulator [Thermoleophilia bacterium]
FPIVVLGRPNTESGAPLYDRLAAVANLTLLDRPTRPFTLVAVARAALRARRRQYQMREHLDELKAARAEAERAGRMKDEFLATLSHELRTPLSAIAGWVSLLQRDALSVEDRRKAVETIARNTRAQRELIEDLLEMSRIIAGKVRLDLQPLRLEQLVLNACESVQPVAVAKGVTLVCRARPSGEGTPVIGDPARLQQAVWNLVTNAVKFTARGGSVTVTVERSGDGATVAVEDTGVGIAADFLPYVFDRFRQADGSSRRSHGGLGLGLSIVKQLVEMHGGHVAVASAGPGAGARFSFTLPVRSGVPAFGAPEPGPSGEGPAQPAVEEPELSGVSVLLVDDDADGRDVMARFLAGAQADVRTASSVREARGLLTEHPADVLLSDIGMPDENGYDLIRWVRRSADPAVRTIPAAAITAFARAEDRAEAIAAGYDEHIAKPVDAAVLIATVDRLRAPSPAREPAAGRSG